MNKKMMLLVAVLAVFVAMSAQVFAVVYAPNQNNDIVIENIMPIDGEEAEEIVGDLNGDEKVNAEDAAIIMDIYKAGNPTEEQLEIADLNGDGKVNAEDAAIIMDIYKAN